MLACLLTIATNVTAESWKKHVVVPPVESMINSVVANDFDGDGHVDILSSYDGRVVLLKGPRWIPYVVHVFDESHSRNKPRTSCIHSCLLDVDVAGPVDEYCEVLLHLGQDHVGVLEWIYLKLGLESTWVQRLALRWPPGVTYL